MRLVLRWFFEFYCKKGKGGYFINELVLFITIVDVVKEDFYKVLVGFFLLEVENDIVVIVEKIDYENVYIKINSWCCIECLF